MENHHTEYEYKLVRRIKELLPTIVDNINNDDRVPWCNEVTADDITVSRVPEAFASHNSAIENAADRAMDFVNDNVVKPSLLKTRLVFVRDQFEGRLLLADLFHYNPKDNTLGLATLHITPNGEISRVQFVQQYKDGEKFSKKSAEFFSAVFVNLLLNSADDNEEISGLKYEVVDGIELYYYKDILESGYLDAQVQLPPRALPRIRSELGKEFKHYGLRKPRIMSEREERELRTLYGPNLEKLPNRITQADERYYRELGTKLEASNELWWVSEDMSKLVWDVTMSGTEPEDLSVEDLPAPTGLMWLNGGGGPILAVKRFPDKDFFKTGKTETDLLTISAIAWHTLEEPIPGYAAGETRFVALTATQPFVEDSSQWSGTVSPVNLESEEVERYRLPTYVTDTSNLKSLSRKVALVAMRLAKEDRLGETIAEPLKTKTKSKGKKKGRRPTLEKGLESIPTVTCSYLRKTHYASAAEREEARKFSHRWIVRGHMRNQRYGPRNVEGGQHHERVWIAPYVKGPDDKPLILKDRVQLFQ